MRSEDVDTCADDWCICDKHIEVIKQMAAAEKLTFIDIAKERLSLVENP